MDPDGKCRAKNTNNQEERKGRCWKSWTSLRPERPGTKPKGTKQQRMTNAKEDPRYTETASKVGQANSPGGKQTDKESTKKKEETRGKGKGARTPSTGPMPDRGENREKGARTAGRETNKPKSNTVVLLHDARWD